MDEKNDQLEEVLDPECIFMIIGGQDKMDIFIKIMDEKLEADNSSL